MALKRGPLFVDLSPLRESPVFRQLFLARVFILFAVGMVAMTVPVHVYAITASTAKVGFVAAVEGVAFLCGFLFGGVLADRHDRWRIIRVARYGTLVSFAGLTVNAVLGGPVWMIAVLVAVNGASGATAITAMLAVLPGLVDRSKLHAVAALNTLSLRVGSVLAPLAGGVLVAAAGPAWSYGIGAATATVTATLFRRPELAGGAAIDGLAVGGGVGVGTASTVPRESPLTALLAGYRFIVRDRVVLGVMAAGVVGLIGGGSRVLIPALAETRFGQTPLVVGLMYSAISAGLLLGALSSGWIQRVERPGLLLLLMMILCFLCFAAAGAAPVVVLALLALVAAGAVNSVEEVLRYALLQQRTPDELRGRVNSVFAAQNMSGIALGAVVAGGLGAWLDPVTAFWGYNLAMAGVGVVVVLVLPGLRRHRAERPPARSGEEDDECARR